MSIYGIGCDVVDLARIKTAYRRNGETFARRILTELEWPVFQQRLLANEDRGLRYLAGRWAAKEAVAKALGTGFRSPVEINAISILNNELGAPVAEFGSELKAHVAHQGLRIHLSISDSDLVSMASAVCERINDNGKS